MLQRLNALDEEIKIAIIGIGSIGKGLVVQAQLTPGIECVAIADIKHEKAIACAEWLERDYEIVHNVNALHDAVNRGKLAISDDGQLVAQCELIDALIESSSAIEAGGIHGITALKHNSHLIMMNYDADLLYGPLLMSLAEQNGLVYTSCDGDQPATIKRLIDDILLWGFDLVLAGNIKGYLDRRTNPTTIIPEADKRELDYRMCTSYTDGTKLNVEMAVLANALGLRTAVPGMLGPRAKHVREVFEHFDLDCLWQETRQPLVDYLLGAEPLGGVFVIGHTVQEFQQFTLDWYPSDMGPGPYYYFYRPFHLGHIEAMACVAEAVLDGRALLKPDYGFQTNVFSYARKDLRQGDVLDGIGGYTCYGLIENMVDDASQPGIPICLADQVILRRDISKDDKIGIHDVLFDPGEMRFKLYFDALIQAGQLVPEMENSPFRSTVTA
jgi:predicted homoserine dehydrogenase-like protein